MNKKLLLIFFLMYFGTICSAQTFIAGANQPGINVGNDHFSYKGKDVSFYSLGWYNESVDVPPHAYLSSYSGLKFFTFGQLRGYLDDQGNLGLNTDAPQSYFHGGNNKVLEIVNTNSTQHSQSHLILSTASTLPESSAGTITWIAKNAQANKGMAYIAVQSKGDATINASGQMYFATSSGPYPTVNMIIDQIGYVGIGLTNPTERLTVNGKIKAREIKVDVQGMPDYVFKPGYEKLPLPELEKYIKNHQHLPEIPSALTAEKEGIELGEMNKLLLKKIEELTLHLIDQDKEVKELKTRAEKVRLLEERIAGLENLIKGIKK